MERIEVRSRQGCEMIEVTERVREAVARSGVSEGSVLVYVPHTTAGVTVNENADPDVVHDLLRQLEEMVPQRQPFFRHAEGNSAAHVKATLVGSSVIVPVAESRLGLGRWQGVYLCEFDGPRARSLWVQVLRNTPAGA